MTMAGGMRSSWQQLEHQVASTIASARDEAGLLLARTDCLRRALAQSEGLAVREILREFHDLELEDVIGGIVAILRECLLVMVATTGGGALIGGIAGGLGGAGVGALPGAALGATAGAQLGEWILAFMGLEAIATYIVRDMPRIVRIYWRGIQEAWRAARPASLPRQAVHEDHAAIGRAAQTLARGHVAMFVLLLVGIVAYLSKGRGSVGELAQSVRASKLGPKFSRWLVKNEGKLKAEPRLQPAESPVATGSATDAPRASPPVRKARPKDAGTSGTKTPPASDSKKPSAGGKYGKVPESISTSSGISIRPSEGKTTTVLGSFSSDMNGIINGQLAYPKTTNFGAKPGGFNVLNVPDSMFSTRTPEQFWTQVNAPFLDAAMRRGDPIYIATRPTLDVLVKQDGSLTGFGREMQYLAKNGYRYDASTGLMAKPGE
ncbi:DUF6861 domain-containing protein [Frateuria sp. YIM B11624]|uniref:DUF6861 domain-containing protein n=1 Tax=Frateuria sp. YIM B11624 TaxID=3143185 RepID=UPI003C70E7E3